MEAWTFYRSLYVYLIIYNFIISFYIYSIFKQRFFTTAVSTYRNKSSVFEYSAGGLLAGSMYKLPMGPKAMVSGGLAGVALGTVAGCVSVGIMKLTGTTTEELRYWKKGWKEASNRYFGVYE